MQTLLSSCGFSATIDHRGAELVSLTGDNGRQYIWEGDPAFWGKHAPVLFPIVGTLKGNRYRYNGREYHLPRHGFARDREFTRIGHNDHEATFALVSDDETLAAYPFAFELHIIYSLNGSLLSVGYRILNKTDAPMLFSIGAHPAFALPGNFEDYTLGFEKSEKPVYHLLEDDLLSDRTLQLPLTDRKLPLHYGLFANDALVFKTIESRALTIIHRNDPVLTVEFDGFPNLGLWTKPDAPFLCIEPWIGYADTTRATGELSDKEGIRLLDPHGNFETKFSIKMR